MSGSPSSPGVWPRCQGLWWEHFPLTPVCIPALCSSIADGHLLCDPEHKGTWGSCFGCKYGGVFFSPLKGLLPSGPHHRAALPHMLPAGVKGLGRLALCTPLC